MSRLRVRQVYLYQGGTTEIYFKSEVDRLLEQHGISRFDEVPTAEQPRTTGGTKVLFKRRRRT